MSCRHKALKSAPKRQQRQYLTYKGSVIPKRRGSKKRPYDKSPRLQSTCDRFCVVMVVFDGLRSTLIWSKFRKSSWESMPPDPHTTLCVMMRAPHGCTNPTLCMPPLQCLDPPLKRSIHRRSREKRARREQEKVV